MCKKRILSWLRGIGILIALLLIVPFILNSLLRTSNPCHIVTIGGPTDWLVFWGSYLGGILTACIGYITLFRANKRYNDDALNSRREAIKNDLIELVGVFDFHYITRLFSWNDRYMVSAEVLQKEIEGLKERYERSDAVSIRWGVRYNILNTNNVEDKDNLDDYNSYLLSLVLCYQKDIDEAISLLAKRIEKGNLNKEVVDTFVKEVHQHSLLYAMTMNSNIKKWAEELSMVS